MSGALRYACRMSAPESSSSFILNGRRVALDGANPDQSLLRWLRAQHLSGTKEGCGDGDCGACTVAMVETDAQGVSRYVAVNSCLLPLGLLPGREVFTVEALAQGEQLHPVQAAMVDCAGSQCGYCTPGFVMSLFAGWYGDELSDHATEGNLCRCTGYRSIRAATAQAAGVRAQRPPPDRFDAVLNLPRAALGAAQLASWFSPATLREAVELKRAHADSAYIAGGTDLGVNLSHGKTVAATLIALDRIAQLRSIDIADAEICIGAGVPLTRIEHELAGALPPLDDMLPWFAARQVRNRATLGGNLGSASPIGDLAPILLALDAQVELFGADGARSLPIDGFFTGYRTTLRAPEEIIVAVRIPRPAATVACASYKVAKRQTDDISIVAAAFALGFDAQRRVSHARLAYGGVAATPVRARLAESLLLGKPLDGALLEDVLAALHSEFTPLSDHRASAGYRNRLIANLFAKFVAEKGLLADREALA